MRRKKSTKPSKTISQKLHFKKRFLERVGIDCDRRLHNEILSNVQNGKYKVHCKQSNRVTVFEMNHESRDYLIFYDRMRKSLITIIPAEEN